MQPGERREVEGRNRASERERERESLLGAVVTGYDRPGRAAAYNKVTIEQ